MTNDTAGVPAHHIAGTNFIMVHLDLVDDLDGDFHAALLLDRIRFRAGDGWWVATRKQLMADTRLNEYHLKRSLKKLTDLGFIETVRVSAYDATLQYRVVIVETTEKANSAVSESRISPPETANSAGSDVANSAVSTSTKNSEELSKNPPIVPHPFDEFWKAYPRKEDKGHARKAFTKAVGKVGAEFLVRAAVEFRQWCEREGKEKQFIPMASTWLNGERWEDERVSTKQPDRMDAHIAHINELWETETVENPQKQLER